MPTFTYKAKSGPGKIVQGAVESENRLTALEKLARMGYYPLQLEERDAGAPSRDFTIFGRISLKDLGLFTRQTSDLLESGVPLIRALQVVGGQTENMRLKRITEEMVAHVEGGKSLSDAMRLYPRIFTPLYVNLVKAGESAGVLGTTLSRLSDFTEQEDDLRSRVTAAMAY